MRVPLITGTIDRRILINYQADKEVIEKFLPRPFRPKLINGKAIVGICLIRLKHIRPKGFPFRMGISSENGAHRIAVEWIEKGEVKEGVYVPRRDTSSRLNFLAGGRVFPGVHHLAKFDIEESNNNYHIQFSSDDDTFLSIDASDTNEWSTSSLFNNLQCASDFFKQGSLGYSPSKHKDSFEGLELRTMKWEVAPLKVSQVRSSFFEDKSIFPEGAVSFDNALVMRNLDHDWKSRGTFISQE